MSETPEVMRAVVLWFDYDYTTAPFDFLDFLAACAFWHYHDAHKHLSNWKYMTGTTR